MEKIKVNTGYNYFAIIKTLSGTYVCPGWTPVPEGTTREQIELVIDVKPSPVKDTTEVKPEPRKAWKVEASKPGKFYQVTVLNGIWDCTCPSKMFHRGDCKHIKAVKSEKKVVESFSV